MKQYWHEAASCLTNSLNVVFSTVPGDNRVLSEFVISVFYSLQTNEAMSRAHATTTKQHHHRVPVRCILHYMLCKKSVGCYVLIITKFHITLRAHKADVCLLVNKPVRSLSCSDKWGEALVAFVVVKLLLVLVLSVGGEVCARHPNMTHRRRNVSSDIFENGDNCMVDMAWGGNEFEIENLRSRWIHFGMVERQVASGFVRTQQMDWMNKRERVNPNTQYKLPICLIFPALLTTVVVLRYIRLDMDEMCDVCLTLFHTPE